MHSLWCNALWIKASTGRHMLFCNLLYMRTNTIVSPIKQSDRIKVSWPPLSLSDVSTHTSKMQGRLWLSRARASLLGTQLFGRRTVQNKDYFSHPRTLTRRWERHTNNRSSHSSGTGFARWLAEVKDQRRGSGFLGNHRGTFCLFARGEMSK